ncbi:MAG: BTAD domain-containing putative transcriptional regulator [Acidimicrobiales bacterium]
MGAEEPVRLAVLGDVVLYDDTGAETPLAPQRLRILAALAAAAGSVVPRSVLLDDVWGADTTTTRQRLKTQIAQIRAALGPGLSIEFRLDGYRLSGALHQLDSTLFESLVTGARFLDPEAAAGRYEQALDLWRTPAAFAGVDSLLVDEARRNLEALRATAVVALARCEVELSRPRAALGPVRAAFDDDPTQGDVASLAATLLALGGRQIDALRLIERHRAALVDVGLEPGGDLVELENRILRHDLIPAAPAGDVPSAAPRAALRPTSQVVPRAGVEERVVAELARGPVVLWGEAGVGKSVLAGAVADQMAAAGRPVVRTAARPDPGRPMEVVAELVEHLTAGGSDLARPLLDRPATAAAVARLTGAPATGPALPISRDELIIEITDLLATVAESTGCLLQLEDAHWLDASSAEILGRLVERGTVPVLATSRRLPADLFGDPWRRMAAVEVPPMTVEEVRQLVHHVLPIRATDELAHHLHERTGGNGLFLRLELELAAEGRLGRDVQPTVLHAVHERTAGFSRATREVLHTAALLGQTFPLAPLAAIHPTLHGALDDAVDEGLLVVDPSGATGTFAHGLVVDALVELLPAAVRVTRHDQLCTQLAALGAAPVALARQALGAADLDPLRAVRSCLEAARSEAQVFEWAAVIDWAGHGLAVIEHLGIDVPADEAALRLMAGRGMRRLNRAGSDRELLEAAARAEAAGDDACYVEVATELCLHGGTTLAGSVDEGARAHLERALGLAVGDELRAPLMAAAGTLLAISDETDRGRQLYRRAMELTDGRGDPATRRTVLMNAHLGLPHPDDLDLRRRAAADIAAFDDHEAQWEGRYLAFGLALIDADRAALDDAAADLHRLTSAVRQRDHQQSLRQVASVHAFIRGDLDEAGRLAEEVLASSLETFSLSWAASIHYALIGPVREAQGRAGELWPQIAALAEHSPEFVTWHVVAASVAYAAGDAEAMDRELGLVAGTGLALAQDLTLTAAATVLCRPVWARRAVALAGPLYELLSPYAGRMAWNGLSTHGPVDAGLALLADVLGRSAAADDHLERSRAMVDHLGAPHLWWPELGRLTEERDADAMPHLG